MAKTRNQQQCRMWLNHQNENECIVLTQSEPQFEQFGLAYKVLWAQTSNQHLCRTEKK